MQDAAQYRSGEEEDDTDSVTLRSPMGLFANETTPLANARSFRKWHAHWPMLTRALSHPPMHFIHQ